MALGKRGMQQHPTQRPSEDAHEHEHTDAHGTHDPSSQPGVAQVNAGYPWKRYCLDRRRIIAESRHTYAEMPVCPARTWMLCCGLDHMKVYTCGKKFLPTFPNRSVPVKSMA